MRSSRGARFFHELFTAMPCVLYSLLLLAEASEDLSLTGRCHSHRSPIDSKCHGCPPKMHGKLCASTTWYTDTTRGACGCGKRGHQDRDFWTLTEYTAALNCANLDKDPGKSWCPTHCGQCYKLCTTGGATQGRSPKAGVCRVFKITNRCGDGYDDDTADWCSQHMSFTQCEQEPGKCIHHGATNQFGYPAHFDLMDFVQQITSNTTGLDWDNAEVTFEKVSCQQWTGPKDVQCTGCTYGKRVQKHSRHRKLLLTRRAKVFRNASRSSFLEESFTKCSDMGQCAF